MTKKEGTSWLLPLTREQRVKVIEQFLSTKFSSYGLLIDLKTNHPETFFSDPIKSAFWLEIENVRKKLETSSDKLILEMLFDLQGQKLVNEKVANRQEFESKKANLSALQSERAKKNRGGHKYLNAAIDAILINDLNVHWKKLLDSIQKDYYWLDLIIEEDEATDNRGKTIRWIEREKESTVKQRVNPDRVMDYRYFPAKVSKRREAVSKKN
jgi:hypothetical protein